MVVDERPTRSATTQAEPRDVGLGRLGAWIEARSAAAVATACVAAIIVLGLIDWATGPQIAFSIFYLIPIGLVSWKLGRQPGYFLSVLAAVTWQTADILADERYDHIAIPIWNMTARMAVFLVVATLLAVLRDALESQRQLARTDSLTGLVNGRQFHHLAHEAAAEAREHKQPLTIAYLDLDNFKNVNDVLGHAGGDEVLQLVARALDKYTRATDTVGRLGGDEFGLILRATGVKAARHLMSSLVERAQSTLQEFDWPVGLSAGAVTFLVPPHDSDEMIDLADGLMYEAKRSGKGHFRQRVVGEDEVNAWPHEGPSRQRRS